MMGNWKEAFWLTKLELKYYAKSLLLLLGILIMLLIFIVPTMADYFENSTLGIDVLFILAFCITTWVKPKQFQNQYNSNELLLSPYLVMLNQLPAKKEIIVKHRFLTYIFISTPFNILFLVSFYILTPIVQDTMPIGTYFVFSIFWLCLSVYIGCSELVTEAGVNKVFAIIRGLVLGFVSVIAMILIFHKIYTRGFVHWTIYISTNYPVLVILVSISLAIIGFNFWMKRMYRKIEVIDYL